MGVNGVGNGARICREEVTLEELDRAKKTYLNGFVFSFDSTGKIVSRLMAYDYYGYPADTLEHFQEKWMPVSVRKCVTKKLSVFAVRRKAERLLGMKDHDGQNGYSGR